MIRLALLLTLLFAMPRAPARAAEPQPAATRDASANTNADAGIAGAESDADAGIASANTNADAGIASANTNADAGIAGAGSNAAAGIAGAESDADAGAPSVVVAPPPPGPPGLPRARLSASEPPTQQELDDREGFRHPSCNPRWGAAFPGLGALCTGRETEGQILLGAGALELGTGLVVGAINGFATSAAEVPLLGFGDSIHRRGLRREPPRPARAPPRLRAARDAR